MQDLINEKILTFKKNDPNIDILVTRSDNDDVRRSPNTLKTSTYQKDFKTLKASIGDIRAIIGLAPNDQVITIKQLKEKIRILKQKRDSKV